jgi:hypothetical protein
MIITVDNFYNNRDKDKERSLGECFFRGRSYSLVIVETKIKKNMVIYINRGKFFFKLSEL